MSFAEVICYLSEIFTVVLECIFLCGFCRDEFEEFHGQDLVVGMEECCIVWVAGRSLDEKQESGDDGHGVIG